MPTRIAAFLFLVILPGSTLGTDLIDSLVQFDVREFHENWPYLEDETDDDWTSDDSESSEDLEKMGFDPYGWCLERMSDLPMSTLVKIESNPELLRDIAKRRCGFSLFSTRLMIQSPLFGTKVGAIPSDPDGDPSGPIVLPWKVIPVLDAQWAPEKLLSRGTPARKRPSERMAGVQLLSANRRWTAALID